MPVPPTAEQWERLRPTIAEMYTRRTLKDIRAQLKDRHGFHATERMYKGRLKSWGIEKNKRHNRRPPPPPPPPPQLTPPKESVRPPGAVACQSRPAIVTTPSDGGHHGKEPLAPQPSSPSPCASTPGASPYPRDDGLETRSTTCVGTPPPSFPPTPATTLGYRSPSVYDLGDAGGDPEVLCREIVNAAVSILSNLVRGRPAGSGFEDWTPTGDDHFDIYRTLGEKLRYESHIRGCFVNNPRSANTTDLRQNVKALLDNFHEAVPIGILSTINQSLDHHAIQELASCLVTSSLDMPRPNPDFVFLAHRLRRLLVMTTFETFQRLMECICEELEGKVLRVLGQRSLVMVYLVFLLNAKKVKSKQQLDHHILSTAMGRMTHVQANYGHEALVVIQFSQFIIGYRNLARPEGQFDQVVLDMAEECYKRSDRHLREQEEARGASDAEYTDAKSHHGKSCSLLADCRHSQGNADEYAWNRAELHDGSRRLLLMAIMCYVEVPMGTVPHYDRQKQKLEGWCREAGDDARLRQLEGIEGLVQANEPRPRNGPLIPRLRALYPAPGPRLPGTQIGTEKERLGDDGKPDR